jgi:hypothetical protein
VGEWKSWRNPVCGITCFTNLAMVLALVAVAYGRPLRVWGMVLLFCAILNAGWVYWLLADAEFVSDLQVGYYLWTTSFAIAGVGMLSWRRQARKGR